MQIATEDDVQEMQQNLEQLNSLKEYEENRQIELKRRITELRDNNKNKKIIYNWLHESLVKCGQDEKIRYN